MNPNPDEKRKQQFETRQKVLSKAANFSTPLCIMLVLIPIPIHSHHMFCWRFSVDPNFLGLFLRFCRNEMGMQHPLLADDITLRSESGISSS
jgi:hypothetical protein